MPSESWDGYDYCVPIVFCFMIRDGEILLIRRANEPYKGQVTIPGGRKRKGESLREACAREMLEETGLVLGEMRFAGVLHAMREGSDVEYVSYYHVCEDFTGELTASDEGELLWAGLDESLSLPGIHPYYVALLPFVRRGEAFDVTMRMGSSGEA